MSSVPGIMNYGTSPRSNGGLFLRLIIKNEVLWPRLEMRRDSRRRPILETRATGGPPSTPNIGTTEPSKTLYWKKQVGLVNSIRAHWDYRQAAKYAL